MRLFLVFYIQKTFSNENKDKSNNNINMIETNMYIYIYIYVLNYICIVTFFLQNFLKIFVKQEYGNGIAFLQQILQVV